MSLMPQSKHEDEPSPEVMENILAVLKKYSNMKIKKQYCRDKNTCQSFDKEYCWYKKDKGMINETIGTECVRNNKK